MSVFSTLGLSDKLREIGSALPELTGYTIQTEAQSYETQFNFSLKNPVKSYPFSIKFSVNKNFSFKIEQNPSVNAILVPSDKIVEWRLVGLITKIVCFIGKPFFCWFNNKVTEREQILDLFIEYLEKPYNLAEFDSKQKEFSKISYSKIFTNQRVACKYALIKGFFEKSTSDLDQALKLATDDKLRLYAYLGLFRLERPVNKEIHDLFQSGIKVDLEGINSSFDEIFDDFSKSDIGHLAHMNKIVHSYLSCNLGTIHQPLAEALSPTLKARFYNFSAHLLLRDYYAGRLSIDLETCLNQTKVALENGMRSAEKTQDTEELNVLNENLEQLELLNIEIKNCRLPVAKNN